MPRRCARLKAAPKGRGITVKGFLFSLVLFIYLFIYRSFIFRRERDSVAVGMVVFHQRPANLPSSDMQSRPRWHQKDPIGGPRESGRRCRARCREAKRGTTPPAVDWVGTQNSSILMRGVAVDAGLSLNPLGKSPCGSMAALHQHTLSVIYLFIILCFFFPLQQNNGILLV